jgi:hypothetical protein
MLNGFANECGERAAAEKVLTYQNQFNGAILETAVALDLPAWLLKGLIAQESQFWPYAYSPYEIGLGQITENGADLLMRWNLNYFVDLCVPLYGEDGCSGGFDQLSKDRQIILRGSALQTAGTEQEIYLIAATLLASAEQTRQMIINVTQQEPGRLMTYEDLWKLTTANYHAGIGCVSEAFETTYELDQSLEWNTIRSHLQGECGLAVEYVNQVFSIKN